MTNSVLFYDNKFTNCYYFIITRAKQQDRKRYKKDHTLYIYYERHHIIPKCLGGSNDSNNLVLLTAREHFICHWLLTYMPRNEGDRNKMLHAINRFNRKHDLKNIGNLSNEYEKLRLERAQKLSEQNKGTGNPMFGKRFKKKNPSPTKGIKYTKEEKEQLYGSRIGQQRTEETKKNISNALQGKPLAGSHLVNVRKANAARKGKPLTGIHLDNVRKATKWQKGYKKSQETLNKYRNTINEQQANRYYKITHSTKGEFIVNKFTCSEYGLKLDGLRKAIRRNIPYKGFKVEKFSYDLKP